MENAKVIKALRNCAKAVTYCNECPYDGKEWAVGCEEELMLAAADALEADEQRIEEMEKQLPKEGKWIEYRTWGFSYASPLITNYHCSICDHEESHNKYHYCPNCGARMRGEHDE